MEIRFLSDCTFQQALDAWNTGFQEYGRDLRMNLSNWIKRCAREDISPELSLVAFDGETPIGFVLNGLRLINGKKVAWNGGTGVKPAYRGHGIGSKLLTKCIEVYRDSNVQTVYLEALHDNHSAISLYRKFGFQELGHLLTLESTQTPTIVPIMQTTELTLSQVPPSLLMQEITPMHVYPWHTWWESVTDGEAIICRDRTGGVLGYALYKKTLSAETSSITDIAIYQCEISEKAMNLADVLETIIGSILAPFEHPCRYHTVNIPASNQPVVEFLTAKLGWEITMTEVHMALSL